MSLEALRAHRRKILELAERHGARLAWRSGHATHIR
jgi:hypothetical protein